MPRTGQRLPPRRRVRRRPRVARVAARARAAHLDLRRQVRLGARHRVPSRKANQRFGITPSLIARYTTGTPLGIKVRSRLGPDDLLIVAAALTNGSSVIEPFPSTTRPTATRARRPAGASRSRCRCRSASSSASPGMYGAQDRALDSRHPIWFEGADLQLADDALPAQGRAAARSRDGEEGAVAEGAQARLRARSQGRRLRPGDRDGDLGVRRPAARASFATRWSGSAIRCCRHRRRRRRRIAST